MKNTLLQFFQRYKFYVSTGLFLIVWITFFDHANLISQSRLWLKCRDFENKIAYYEAELINVKKEKKELLGSNDALETFGREKYFMKKEGETVFVLVDEAGELMEEK